VRYSIQQAGAPKTAAKNVTPVAFTRGHWLMITKGQIQVCVFY